MSHKKNVGFRQPLKFWGGGSWSVGGRSFPPKHSSFPPHAKKPVLGDFWAVFYTPSKAIYIAVVWHKNG